MSPSFDLSSDQRPSVAVPVPPVSLWLARVLLCAQALIAVALARWGEDGELLRNVWTLMTLIAVFTVMADTQLRVVRAQSLLHWLSHRRVPGARRQAVAHAHALAWMGSVAWPMGALALAAICQGLPLGLWPLFACVWVMALVMAGQERCPPGQVAASRRRPLLAAIGIGLVFGGTGFFPASASWGWTAAAALMSMGAAGLCAAHWRGLAAASSHQPWAGSLTVREWVRREESRWRPVHPPKSQMSALNDSVPSTSSAVVLNVVMPYFSMGVIFKGGLFWGQGATSGEPLLLVLLAIQWMMALMIRDWQPRQALWPVGDRQQAGRRMAWRIWRDSLRPFALALAVLLAARMAWWQWLGWPSAQAAAMAVVGPACLVLPVVALATWFSGLAKQHALHCRRGLPQPAWNWTTVGVLVVTGGLVLSLALTWWAWGDGGLSWNQAWAAMARSRQSGFVLPISPWLGALLMLSLTPVFLWAASRVWARLPAECLTRADEAGSVCVGSATPARRRWAGA